MERILQTASNSDFGLCVSNNKWLWVQFCAECNEFFHRFPGRDDVLRFQGARRMQNHSLPSSSPS